jgi:hypothetical protein
MTPIYYLGGQVNRSDWLEPPQQPWEPGIYECEWWHEGIKMRSNYFNYFDGSQWRAGAKHLENVRTNAPVAVGKWTLVRWCGLAEKPQ